VELGRLDCQSLDDEVIALDSMDMMVLSVWLCFALNGVEDIEDWRSALSV